MPARAAAVLPQLAMDAPVDSLERNDSPSDRLHCDFTRPWWVHTQPAVACDVCDYVDRLLVVTALEEVKQMATDWSSLVSNDTVHNQSLAL